MGVKVADARLISLKDRDGGFDKQTDWIRYILSFPVVT